MHNTWSTLIIFLFGDPHLLKAGERREDWSTDPHRVLSFRGRYHFRLQGWGNNAVQFLLHSISNTYNTRSTSMSEWSIIIYKWVDLLFFISLRTHETQASSQSQGRLWSDWASFCWFCHEMARLSLVDSDPLLCHFLEISINILSKD